MYTYGLVWNRRRTLQYNIHHVSFGRCRWWGRNATSRSSNGCRGRGGFRDCNLTLQLFVSTRLSPISALRALVRLYPLPCPATGESSADVIVWAAIVHIWIWVIFYLWRWYYPPRVRECIRSFSMQINYRYSSRMYLSGFYLLLPAVPNEFSPLSDVTGTLKIMGI